jgi:2-keto-3-deoxy-L-rhamnonate aldolase RhmA
VQQALDGALKKIVKSGRTAGALTGNDGVERLVDMGVRFFLTNINPYMEAGIKDFAARTRGAAMPAGKSRSTARRGGRK